MKDAIESDNCPMGNVFSQKSIHQIVNLFKLNPPKFRFYRNYPPFLKVRNKSDSYFRVLFLNSIHVKSYLIPHTHTHTTFGNDSFYTQIGMTKELFILLDITN